jgi:hypothetical protein
MTIPEGTRKPTDRKPKKQKRKAQPAPPASVLAPDPRYERVNDGYDLLYHARRGFDVLLPLDIPLDTVVEAIELDGNISDPRQAIDFLKRLAGEDILKLGALELLPLFGRWTAELGAAMGGDLGESSSSPA